MQEKYLNADKYFEKKFALKDLFKKYNEIDRIIYSHIQNRSFHDLQKIQRLFKKVLEVSLDDIEELTQFICKRHDFIHRCGKNTEGSDVYTSREEIIRCMEKIEALCQDVDNKINIESPF